MGGVRRAGSEVVGSQGARGVDVEVHAHRLLDRRHLRVVLQKVGDPLLQDEHLRELLLERRLRPGDRLRRLDARVLPRLVADDDLRRLRAVLGDVLDDLPRALEPLGALGHPPAVVELSPSARR